MAMLEADTGCRQSTKDLRPPPSGTGFAERPTRRTERDLKRDGKSSTTQRRGNAISWASGATVTCLLSREEMQGPLSPSRPHSSGFRCRLPVDSQARQTYLTQGMPAEAAFLDSSPLPPAPGSIPITGARHAKSGRRMSGQGFRKTGAEDLFFWSPSGGLRMHALAPEAGVEEPEQGRVTGAVKETSPPPQKKTMTNGTPRFHLAARFTFPPLPTTQGEQIQLDWRATAHPLGGGRPAPVLPGVGERGEASIRFGRPHKQRGRSFLSAAQKRTCGAQRAKYT